MLCAGRVAVAIQLRSMDAEVVAISRLLAVGALQVMRDQWGLPRGAVAFCLCHQCGYPQCRLQMQQCAPVLYRRASHAQTHVKCAGVWYFACDLLCSLRWSTSSVGWRRRRSTSQEMSCATASRVSQHSTAWSASSGLSALLSTVLCSCMHPDGQRSCQVPPARWCEC